MEKISFNNIDELKEWTQTGLPSIQDKIEYKFSEDNSRQFIESLGVEFDENDKIIMNWEREEDAVFVDSYEVNYFIDVIVGLRKKRVQKLEEIISKCLQDVRNGCSFCDVDFRLYKV